MDGARGEAGEHFDYLDAFPNHHLKMLGLDDAMDRDGITHDVEWMHEPGKSAGVRSVVSLVGPDGKTRSQRHTLSRQSGAGSYTHQIEVMNDAGDWESKKSYDLPSRDHLTTHMIDMHDRLNPPASEDSEAEPEATVPKAPKKAKKVKAPRAAKGSPA